MFSLLVALMLVMLPLPDWAQPLRPDWVSLVVIYWGLALPRRFSVGFGWFCGLLLDVTQGTLLGVHALGTSLLAFIAVRFHQRIRVYPLAQQALVITLMLLLKQSLTLWINGMIGHPPDNLWLYFAPSGLGFLLWPWVFIILRDLRRRYHLA